MPSSYRVGVSPSSGSMTSTAVSRCVRAQVAVLVGALGRQRGRELGHRLARVEGVAVEGRDEPARRDQRAHDALRLTKLGVGHAQRAGEARAASAPSARHDPALVGEAHGALGRLDLRVAAERDHELLAEVEATAKLGVVLLDRLREQRVGVREIVKAVRVVVLDGQRHEGRARHTCQGHVHARDVLIPRVLNQLCDGESFAAPFEQLGKAIAVNLEVRLRRHQSMRDMQKASRPSMPASLRTLEKAPP